jgi:ABC-type sugar transport system ATPase subunit
MASVTYNKVCKRFDNGTEALQDFDLQINDGEFMVMVGPSGCGKSTALRLLAGLESVTSGELLIDNAVVNSVPPQQRNIAMVFQNYALYPHMTVRRNLEFPLRMMKLSAQEIEQRTLRAAALLQLGELLDRMPRQLSGGQRQRVAMGRAIVREPHVFLMDEPLSNLDAKLRVQIRTEIATLQQRLNVTTLYVTHDQVEAMTLGQRVAVMHAGRLQQVAGPQVLYERPANTFVAGFVGSPGMNIIPSRLRPSATGLQFEIAGRWLDVPPECKASHASLRAYQGQSVYAGLRPESLQLVAATEADLELPLATMEVLGHEQLLYFDTGQETPANIIARVPGTAEIEQHGPLPLGVNTRELYFFDPEGSAIY